MTASEVGVRCLLVDPSSGDVKLGVRADRHIIERTLAHLDNAPRDPKSMQRAHRRLSYRERFVEIALQQPQASSAVRFTSPVRNISNRGMAVLHGAFTHKGTRCIVRLIDAEQKTNVVSGEVVRCRYVEHWMHELSIRFDEAIDASRFVRDESRFLVLVIDADATAAGQTAAALLGQGIDSEYAVDTSQAMERAKTQFHDAIIVEPGIPGIDMAGYVVSWRAVGYMRPVIAVTKLTDEPQAGDGSKPGFSAWFCKPLNELDAHELLSVIRTGSASRRAA